MVNVGMTLVRTYRLDPSDPLLDGVPEGVFDGDDVEYALDRSDWEQQQAAVSSVRNESTS